MQRIIIADEIKPTDPNAKRAGSPAWRAFFNWAGALHRPQQAADGWEKVFDFYQRHLG